MSPTWKKAEAGLMGLMAGSIAAAWTGVELPGAILACAIWGMLFYVPSLFYWLGKRSRQG